MQPKLLSKQNVVFRRCDFLGLKEGWQCSWKSKKKNEQCCCNFCVDKKNNLPLSARIILDDNDRKFISRFRESSKNVNQYMCLKAKALHIREVTRTAPSKWVLQINFGNFGYSLLKVDFFPAYIIIMAFQVCLFYLFYGESQSFEKNLSPKGSVRISLIMNH